MTIVHIVCHDCEFEGLDGMVSVAGRGGRSGRHFCHACARALPHRPEEAYEDPDPVTDDDRELVADGGTPPRDADDDIIPIEHMLPDPETHAWVDAVEDVSIGAGPRTVVIHFDAQTLPESVLKDDRLHVTDVWIDIVPGALRRRVLGDDFCRRHGFGRLGLAALVEVGR